MAGAIETKEFITEVFNTICKDTVITKFSGHDKEHFHAEARVKLADLEGENYSEKSDVWVEKFQDLTDSGFIVRETIPNPKNKFLYKKTFVCQHNSLWKKKNNKNARSRDRECNTTYVEVKVLKTTFNTKKTDSLIADGYNVKITVRAANKFL